MRALRHLVRFVCVLAAAAVVLGVAGGLVWQWRAPRPTFLLTVVGPFPASEAEAGQVASADMWFLLVTCVGALIAAAVASLPSVRPRSGPAYLAGLVAAAVLLVALAFVIGQLRAGNAFVLTWEPVGDQNLPTTGPLLLRAWAVVLAPPVVALVLAVLVAAGARDEPQTADVAGADLGTRGLPGPGAS